MLTLIGAVLVALLAWLALLALGLALSSMAGEV